MTEVAARGVSGDSGEKWTATKWMRAGPLGGKKEMEVKARIAGAKKEELKDEPRAKVKTGEHDEN